MSLMRQVLQMNQVPKPPPVRWERYTHCAARCGVPPRAFLDLVHRDPAVRVQHLGKRGLLHIAAEDAEAIVSRLQNGEAR